MNNPKAAAVTTAQQFFHRTIACFQAEDAHFAPQPELYTVAAHIAHAALSIDWLVDGMFAPNGFSMDFAEHDRHARAVTELASAIAMFDRACSAAVNTIGEKTLAELLLPMAPGPVMGGLPRAVAIEAIIDHTAHHRGALSVYARLLGRVPAMPYM